MRSIVAAAALCAALGLVPRRAEAQQTDPVAFWSATISVGAPMLAVDSILIAEAIDKWIEGRYGLYQQGAIFEIVWGGLHVAGAGVAAGVSTLAHDPAPLALTFGVPLAALGAYFLAHGIASLVASDPLAPSRLLLTVGASREGASAIVTGRF